MKLGKTPSMALCLHLGVKNLNLKVNNVEINHVKWMGYEMENN